MRRFHMILLILWFTVGSFVTLMWLSSSVEWVAWMSVYAIVASHFSAWQGAKAEKAAKNNDH